MDNTRSILAALNGIALALLALVVLMQVLGHFWFTAAITADLLLALPSAFGVAVGAANGVLMRFFDRVGPRARAATSAASLLVAMLLIATVIYSTATQYLEGPDIHAAWICSSIVFGATSVFVWTQPPLRKLRECPNCGYNTTGLTTCPECGIAVSLGNAS